MKKYLFFLLLISAVSANAQTFDEADLIGTWTTSGLSYAPYKITNIESITLCNGLYSYEGDKRPFSGCITNITCIEQGWDGEEYTSTDSFENILDFFISNNNKLHIIVDDQYALHFIIEELTATTLKVKTYDGQSYTFTKDSSSSSVSSKSLTRPDDASTYHLNGQKVENVTTDGIYIQNGQKKVIKR